MKKITSSSTAEYFSKNLQQVGFSSLTKAVLTTLKEAVDNSLDACEEHHILPEISITIEKMGPGTLKNSEQIKIIVLDNGPGISIDDAPRVFGEYLASSKFGRGRCTRGQQGIGISAATTWAQMTTGKGALITSRQKNMKKAYKALIEVDIKNNKGSIKSKDMIDWQLETGTQVEFVIDGRLQLNGDGGLHNYIQGTALVNPHLTVHVSLPGEKPLTIQRVSLETPKVPEATEPHPHTMKLGEFIAHSHLFGRTKTSLWLKRGFSRLGDSAIEELQKKSNVLNKFVDTLKEDDFKNLYAQIQSLELKAPATSSVLSIGEEALAASIQRLGEIDYFSVVTRKPTICDFKPIQVEVAIARLKLKSQQNDEPVQLLRFANRVPLQFDKSGCALFQSICSVNWRSYGLVQPKDSLPVGPYIFAISVVSPFIKFKNASKETIDSSDELVEEIRRALMQAGQKLSKHIRREDKADELEERIRHIEQFAPILVESLSRIVKAPKDRKLRAEEGLRRILGRDAKLTEQELAQAEQKLEELK